MLDDRLVAIGPDGARYTKSEDLAAYLSGSSVVSDLVEEDVEVTTWLITATANTPGTGLTWWSQA